MPSTGGGVADSTVTISRPIDIVSAPRQGSGGLMPTTTASVVLDDREIFKALHDSMKDVGKFRQYIYYLGTSCDTTRLRNKIQKLKERINRSFFQQRENMRTTVLSNAMAKGDSAMHRLEKWLCFVLASLSYYEDLLHKFSILLVYFPLASGDRTNVVNLGFEDSTINSDEASHENLEAEENETNRYIELLNQIQNIETLREDIEQIDVYQLRHNATSYSKEFVDNMHKYNDEVSAEGRMRDQSGRHPYYLRHQHSSDDSSSPISMCRRRCNRRKFLCTLTIILLSLIIVAVIVTIIVATNKASTGGQ